MKDDLKESITIITKELSFEDTEEKVVTHYQCLRDKEVIQHISNMDSNHKVLHINKIEANGVIKGLKPEFIDGQMKLVVISETANNVEIPHGIDLRLQKVFDEDAHPLFGIRELLNHPQMESWLLAHKENPMKIAVALTAGCWTLEK